jgi:hypothetical protein
MPEAYEELQTLDNRAFTTEKRPDNNETDLRKLCTGIGLFGEVNFTELLIITVF